MNGMGIVQMSKKGVVRGGPGSSETGRPKCAAFALGKAHQAKMPRLRSTENSPEMLNLVNT